MFGLGAGMETPALHNADYDFPDEIIETGINMFQSIISNILQDFDQKF
jgi:metal-dependent amidase/aminoacylase/carboxypeptidase family protein